MLGEQEPNRDHAGRFNAVQEQSWPERCLICVPKRMAGTHILQRQPNRALDSERHVHRSALARVNHGHELEVEGVAVVSNADGVAVDVHHHREDDAEVPAEAVLRVCGRGGSTGLSGTQSRCLAAGRALAIPI